MPNFNKDKSQNTIHLKQQHLCFRARILFTSGKKFMKIPNLYWRHPTRCVYVCVCVWYVKANEELLRIEKDTRPLLHSIINNPDVGLFIKRATRCSVFTHWGITESAFIHLKRHMGPFPERSRFLMVANGNLRGFKVGLPFIVLSLDPFPARLDLDAFSIQVDVSTSAEPPASLNRDTHEV